MISNPFEFFRREKELGDIKFTPETKRELSLREINKLFYLSFQFSQGDITSLQLPFFTFLSKYYGKQKEISLERIRDYHTSKTVNYHDEVPVLKVTDINSHTKVNPVFIESELNDSDKLLDVFLKCLTGSDYKYVQDFTFGDKEETLTTERKDVEEDFNLSEIVESTLHWDIVFTITNKGRPNRLDQNIGNDNLKDKYFSFFVKYIIRKGNTGDESFDNLFLQARNFLPTFFKNRKHKDSLAALIGFYNETHPKTKVTKEELAEVGIKLDI